MKTITQLYLMEAIKHNWFDEVLLLVGSGINLDFTDRRGLSPLTYARSLGERTQIVRLLEQKGAHEAAPRSWKTRSMHAERQNINQKHT